MSACRQVALCACLGLLAASWPAWPAEAPVDEVVLVVSVRSPVVALDAIDVKRLFLGIPVDAGSTQLRGVRNASDVRLTEVFLQHAVAMSDRSYERRLLMLALEQGRHPPASVADEAALFAAIAADPGAVSYGWASVVARHAGLRILRPL